MPTDKILDVSPLALRMSSLYAPTLEEDPAEAELASHRLLLRAGMMRKTAAGSYSFLPLGWRSVAKIERIEDIRDRYVPNFYFGSEADDPTVAYAFNLFK